MGSFLDIQDDPNQVSGTAAILRSMGTTFQSEAQTILGDINAVNAERPWGNDQYGQAFEQTYDVVPEGSDVPLRQVVDEGLGRAGEGLVTSAGKTVLAMTEYQGVDEDNRANINRANLQ
ncbi:hypothetical protein [Phytohabitans houttuyneae]|uniref:Uncharacterized protein n=1 Tax=Phytohabitans houttuyneae TaxID=1076126 RepID=A0A6V8K5M0_9ACTN|nr:hypothetical protein [Phytohabitans houttuyneae]GFJ77701.1 hypothetical protein Phou_018810 [Phytohabitans houttuyneae]